MKPTYGTIAVKSAMLVITALLLFAPFLFQDIRALEVAARICIFIVLVASYDLLIGYTGIVSFAHTMFFGFGAYGSAIALKQMGPGWESVALGTLAGVALSLIVATAIGLISLRVKAIFFAMIYAIWLKYTGPDTALSFAIMIDILLMVVIGGMGTMWGAVIGATMLVLAQYYLRDLMGAASEATAALPLLPELLAPDRWLFWLGIIFILLVYFFPKGIAGTLMARGQRA